MQELTFTDLFYSLYLNPAEVQKDVLITIYKENPVRFTQLINNYFVYDYIKEIYEIVGHEFDLSYSQKLIDDIFKEFALLCHKYIKPDYLKNRGVTDEQITKYKLGSTHCLVDSKITHPFYKLLIHKYENEQLVKNVFKYHHDLLLQNIATFKKAHCTTIPSFDIDSNCNGIVYRTEHYKKFNEIRNISKFYVSHAPIYLFNHATIQKHDELILLEGVFDVLSMERELGIINSISPSYTRISPFHYNAIKDKNIHVLFDGDLGGLYGSKYIHDTYKFNNVGFSLIKNDIDEMCIKDPDFVKQHLEKEKVICHYE